MVDAYQRGDFATVSAAIKAAKPGDRILVRPGLYEEGLVVDKPLEILGDGPVSDIEIRARGAHALVFQASIGRVANLTLRQAGGEGNWFGVDITQGRLDLEGCDISSQSFACVAIRDGADPRLRRNKIHDGKQGGVLSMTAGWARWRTTTSPATPTRAWRSRPAATPPCAATRSTTTSRAASIVYDSGLGTLEDNDITGNTSRAWRSGTGGNPTLRGNQIHDNKAGGVFVYDNGLGTLEDNDITGNAHGRRDQDGRQPDLRGNRINRNGYQAVWIHDGGRGVVEDNDLTGNAKGAWLIAEDCQANLTRARNKE